MAGYDRRVLFCDFNIFDTVRNFKDTSNEPVKLPSVLDLSGFYNFVNKIYESGKAILVARGKRAQIHLQDLQETNFAYHFLLNVTTANGNHHTSRDIETGIRDEKTYKDTEGPEKSCHIVVLKTKDIDQKPLVLVEKVEGVSLFKVGQFFNTILRTGAKDFAADFTKDHPLKETNDRGEVKKVRHTPKITLHGHISETLFRDIDNGVVSGLELISDGPEIAGIDGKEIPENFDSWRVKLDKSPMTNGSKNYIAQLMRQGKAFKMDRLRVSFKDSSDVSHVKHFSIDDSPLDDRDMYVLSKGFTLGFRPRDSYTQCHQKILVAMIELASK